MKTQQIKESIIDRIKTFEDACNEAGISPDKVYHPGDTPDEIAYKKLKLIIRVLNEGWVPDPLQLDEKAYAWRVAFWGGSLDDGARAGLWCAYFSDSSGSAYAAIGARLCLKSRELALYAGSQFFDIYRDFLI